MSWQHALILDPGERIIQSWFGRSERRGKASQGLLPKPEELHRGVLVLTNRRLAWLEEAGGLLSRRYHVQSMLPLETIVGATAGGRLDTFVSITDSQGEKIFHLGLNAYAFEAFRRTLLSQIGVRKQELQEQAQPRAQPQQVIIKEVTTQVVTYCAHCGNMMPITDLYCTHCGAPRKP